ncbi:salicylate carboxymethyltransferase [Amborella trichopoda]|nr:salicylate carboxymethyltransferase [Amborella trichopoda]|eukprot:XP_006847713.2 salicylate carboxymethyltransferase [Amborella trichopoda]
MEVTSVLRMNDHSHRTVARKGIFRQCCSLERESPMEVATALRMNVVAERRIFRQCCSLEKEGPMDVANVLRMNEGTGKMSYAQNSWLQKHGIEVIKPITEEAVMNMLSTHFPERLGIADLGCSSGPNTFSALTIIIEAVCTKYEQVSLPMPEFLLYLNDLPGNDFNSIFRSLPSFYEMMKETGVPESCFVAAVASSFYCRSFPSNSLHFVHSSYSLHWLSQVPPALYDEYGKSLNKGNVYITEDSPASVTYAFLQQFRNDFSRFLKFRSQEVVRDGCMVLMFYGRRTKQAVDEESGVLWTTLSQAIKNLVSKGFIEDEKLDSFDLPYYEPSAEEVEEELKREGSFTILHFEQKPIAPWEANKNAKNLALITRAAVEPLMKYHFGEEVMDMIFEEYTELMQLDFDEGKKKLIHFVLVLKRSN